MGKNRGVFRKKSKNLVVFFEKKQFEAGNKLFIKYYCHVYVSHAFFLCYFFFKHILGQFSKMCAKKLP